jgi:hypothetical protein
MGETRVDLLHLLEDLADAYPGEIEETVLTEIIANALDSRATTITLITDAAAATLTVIDNGTGMRRADLRRFHDVAASSKQRGEGIGFAGVGIKLGLLISDEVVTETKRGAGHVATRWAMTNRKRAPWQWMPPPGMVETHGTAVRLRLSNALSPLLDRGYVEVALRAHFEPLFDPYFDAILRAHYPEGVRFTINGDEVSRSHTSAGTVAPLELRLPRKRLASAFGYVARHDSALTADRRGVAISTYGKVIKRGWDWLGVTPAAADRVTGLIEAPALAGALTLNKVDFLRAGPRGALYLSYRKGLQEAVMSQLAVWGDDADADGHTRRRAARPVERDLEAILIGLTSQFPMLATLVEKRAGGRRKLPAGETGRGASSEAGADLFTPAPEPVTPDNETSDRPGTEAPPERGDEAAPEREPVPEVVERPSSSNRTGRKSKQPIRLGLTIQFESRPDALDMARLIESTVWVNDAHPAHRRAVASRSEGYHLALSVAIALADVAVAPAEARGFINAFLSGWGESIDGKTRPGKRRRPR